MPVVRPSMRTVRRFTGRPGPPQHPPSARATLSVCMPPSSSARPTVPSRNFGGTPDKRRGRHVSLPAARRSSPRSRQGRATAMPVSTSPDRLSIGRLKARLELRACRCQDLIRPASVVRAGFSRKATLVPLSMYEIRFADRFEICGINKGRRSPIPAPSRSTRRTAMHS